MYTTHNFVVFGVPPFVERSWAYSFSWNFMYFNAFFVYVSLSAVGWLLLESQSAESQEHHIELAYLLFYLFTKFSYFLLFFTQCIYSTFRNSLYTHSIVCVRHLFTIKWHYIFIILSIYHSFQMCASKSEVKTNEAKTEIDFRKTNLRYFAWMDSENSLCHHLLRTF